MAVDYFECITLARSLQPIKMRVLRCGIDNFLRCVVDAVDDVSASDDGDKGGVGDAGKGRSKTGSGSGGGGGDGGGDLENLDGSDDDVSEAVLEWGAEVDRVFQVYLFTTYGNQLQRLNDVSMMMWRSGFADLRTVPD